MSRGTPLIIIIIIIISLTQKKKKASHSALSFVNFLCLIKNKKFVINMYVIIFIFKVKINKNYYFSIFLL